MSHLYTAGMDDKLPKLGTLKLLQISKALVEDVDQTINLPVAPCNVRRIWKDDLDIFMEKQPQSLT